MAVGAGLIGLLVGFGFAVFDWLVVLPLIERAGRNQERTGGAYPERGMRLVRVVFLAQFVIFPLIGYVVGRALS